MPLSRLPIKALKETGLLDILKDIFVIKLFSSTAHCDLKIGNCEKIENAKLKKKNGEKEKNIGKKINN